MNELIIKRCFTNASKYINAIEFDGFDSSDDEDVIEDRELERATPEVKKIMKQVIKYHSHLMQAFL